MPTELQNPKPERHISTCQHPSLPGDASASWASHPSPLSRPRCSSLQRPTPSSTRRAQSISFADPSLATDGWTGPAATGSDYDFAVLNPTTLRASNWTSGNDRGVITQLMAPTVQPVGEPFYTTATHDGFSASFTLDSALTTGDRYVAQPGLAIELDADQDGNRAGGGVTFRVTTDHQLEIANYYSKPVDLGETWRNAVTSVPFTGPLNIQYQVKFVAGGVDTATVLVNGVAVLSGGTFEGYTLGAAGHAETVNSILLRAVSREPAASPAPASWNTLPLTDDQNTALKGNGFLFSNIAYGSATSCGRDRLPAQQHRHRAEVLHQGLRGLEPGLVDLRLHRRGTSRAVTP